MKKSILSLLLACFLQINLAFAQNVMKGVVSDANGPLVGVVIHDKDNAKGTTSDMSGKYALNGAESGHTIEFRYLGYVTETVVWDGKSVVNIKLKEDAVLETENHAELEKLNDQLEAIGHHIQLLKEEAREEKENTKEMVSDISHQLKTPVAALDTCFSVLMQNDLSATEQEEFRIRCRSALDGLETLLQSLLEISKMETGLIQINKKKLPLMDTVISAVNCTYPKADEKEIEFVFDYAKELETCMVMQDKRWLGEAVINVLDNAVKYSPGGSKIFIRLQKRNDLVRMEIEDQGIGIPQNEYHKIFQRFYRGSSKEVMEKSGTGIGLFLSREIIEKHAGTITVTSGKKKKGSTFVIQLPYVG